ncbi:MAG: hypothetical protein ACTHMS_21710 [Jatrophihabitans sp.]|uniref:hypothetical protein n=1 Tax=Jatrophihabitans sp. TaxID=1932789 RepID=UPI003F7EC327
MSNGSSRAAVAAVGAIAGAAGALVFAASAHAAQSTQTIECAGTQYTIRTNNNHSSDMGGWSVGQVVGTPGSHGIPTSFGGVATITGTDTVLGTFLSTKGQGNANQHQQQTTCQQSISGTAADVFGPGETPPGLDPSTPVTLTITITVVLKS